MASAMAELHSFHTLCRSAILPSSANVTTRLNSSFLKSKTILSNCKLVARNGAIKLVPKALPEALLFDCDGVLVDTERDGHRVCFNKAFEEQGVAVNWDEEFFGTILDIGIGKKRIANYFDVYGWPESVVSDSQREDFVAALHKRKTALFVDMVESGQLLLRPGVTTLIDEALAKGVKVATNFFLDYVRSDFSLNQETRSEIYSRMQNILHFQHCPISKERCSIRKFSYSGL